jgi:hypothetical protein
MALDEDGNSERSDTPKAKEGVSILPPPGVKQTVDDAMLDSLQALIQQCVEFEEKLAGHPLTWGELQVRGLFAKVKAVLAASE